MWLHSTLKKSSLTLKKNGELIKSDVLVECQQLAAESVNACGAAEAPKEQAGK